MSFPDPAVFAISDLSRPTLFIGQSKGKAVINISGSPFTQGSSTVALKYRSSASASSSSVTSTAWQAIAQARQSSTPTPPLTGSASSTSSTSSSSTSASQSAPVTAASQGSASSSTSSSSSSVQAVALPIVLPQSAAPASSEVLESLREPREDPYAALEQQLLEPRPTSIS